MPDARRVKAIARMLFDRSKVFARGVPVDSKGSRLVNWLTRYRPLDGIKLEDVKATFSDGVLEISVPLSARSEAPVRKVQMKSRKRPRRTRRKMCGE